MLSGTLFHYLKFVWLFDYNAKFFYVYYVLAYQTYRTYQTETAIQTVFEICY